MSGISAQFYSSSVNCPPPDFPAVASPAEVSQLFSSPPVAADVIVPLERPRIDSVVENGIAEVPPVKDGANTGVHKHLKCWFC